MTFCRPLLSAALLSLSVGPALAACRVPVFAFFPERNDNLVVTALIARGTPCVHRLGEGPGYRFTSVTPVLEPEHGSLSIDGHVTLTYRPETAYGGKDAYGIKACATKADGASGCSTIFFVMTPK